MKVCVTWGMVGYTLHVDGYRDQISGAKMVCTLKKGTRRGFLFINQIQKKTRLVPPNPQRIPLHVSATLPIQDIHVPI